MSPTEQPPKLVDSVIATQHDAFQVIILFLNLAQKRGVFTMDESAKIWECMQKFTQPQQSTKDSQTSTKLSPLSEGKEQSTYSDSDSGSDEKMPDLESCSDSQVEVKIEQEEAVKQEEVAEVVKQEEVAEVVKQEVAEVVKQEVVEPTKRISTPQLQAEMTNTASSPDDKYKSGYGGYSTFNQNKSTNSSGYANKWY